MNVRVLDASRITVSVDETTTPADANLLLDILGGGSSTGVTVERLADQACIFPVRCSCNAVLCLYQKGQPAGCNRSIEWFCQNVLWGALMWVRGSCLKVKPTLPDCLM